MSKRSHIESTGGVPDQAGPVPKRTRPVQDDSSDALQTMIDNVEELASCLRRLQSEKAKKDSHLPLKLDDIERLSQKLVPALQDLKAQSKPSTSKVNDTASLQIPPNAIVTKWTAATLSKSHPPLPAVLDEVLKTAALTHSGMTKQPSDPSYERLEWIGDAYCYMIASSLIYQTFPNLDPGKCSQHREILIRNSTLCTYTRLYNLDKHANFPEEFGLQGRIGGTSASDKQRQKVLGDIFEAYVGAVILSDPQNGVQRAAEWLKALWGPELADAIRKEENTKPATSQISPKTELERAISVPGVKIQYRDLPNYRKDKMTKLPMFTVGCFLTGWGETDKQIGFGSALGKKEAGAKAAQLALDNRKLIKVYMDKKKEHMEARAAAQAEAEAKAAAEAFGSVPGN